MLYPVSTDMHQVWTNKHKNLSAIECVDKDSKLIDFDLDGGTQFVRLYAGIGSLENWWGDDWNDAPYEHNAGEVYLGFVKYIVDISFPASSCAVEPCAGEFNSRWCKDDMKARRVPMCIVTSQGDKWGWLPEAFSQIQGDEGVLRIMMGDNLRKILRKLVNEHGAQIMNVFENEEEESSDV